VYLCEDLLVQLIGFKNLQAAVIGITFSVLIFLPSSQGVLASNSPEWSFGSGCKASELWKTRNSKNEVCANQSGKYKWVKTLKSKDVYDLSTFCSTTIKVEASGALCGWNEQWGLTFVKASAPRDNCIELLRQLVYKEAEHYARDPYNASNIVSAWFKTAQKSSGCAK